MARILLVDDSPIMRSIIRETLQRSDHTITGEAGNAAEGMKLFDAEHPDLILLDILLPGESGLELLKKIHHRGTGVKILVVSAVGQEVLTRQVKQFGVNILNKPFDVNELTSAISETLA